MTRALLAMAVVTLLWAGNFTAAKIGTGPEGFSPFLIASIRIFIVAAGFFLFLPREQRKIVRDDWKAVFPLALTGIAINQTCFAAGIQITTPAHSAIIHALIPVAVAIFAGWLIRERLGPLGLLGMTVAVAGALVVMLGASRSEFRGTIAGDLLTIVGMTAFSLYTVLGRRLMGTMGAYRVVTLAFVFAVPLMIPAFVVGLWRQDWSAVTWKGWSALGYMIVAATFVCYSLHIYALSKLTAGQVAIFTDLQPALGTGIAVVAGLDRVTPMLVLGGALAMAGVVLVQLKPKLPTPAPDPVKSPPDVA